MMHRVNEDEAKSRIDHVHGKIAEKRRGVLQAENWKEITSQFSYGENGGRKTSPSIVVSYYMHVGTYLHCIAFQAGWLADLSQSGLFTPSFHSRRRMALNVNFCSYETIWRKLQTNRQRMHQNGSW